MKGTSFSQTVAMDWMPPRMTTAVSTVMMPPVIHGETRNVSWTMVEIEFACTMQPMPKAATAVSAAKTRPSQRAFIPRSSTYIGPPAICPLGVVMRYLTERTASAYFVAMPKTPVSHIQSTAPGPARGHRGGHPHDVAGADRRGERGGEGAELADVSLPSVPRRNESRMARPR